MSLPIDPAKLRRAAATAGRDWPAAKLSMALRAISTEGVSESLDGIAAEFDVSRETVRRARNDLVRSIATAGGTEELAGLPEIAKPSLSDPATSRALRRMLTITGPLTWEELLAGWARAGGKAPYLPLPTDAAALRAWATSIDGVAVVEAVQPTVRSIEPEELDAVSSFLLTMLSNKPRGRDRSDLLTLAERAGLKSTTIATALSTHPAVVRLGRGLWALRGHVGTVAAAEAIAPRRAERPRPTTFSWGANGALELTFSIPRGPSPLLAVPKAIAPLVEGREFTTTSGEKQAHIVVKGGKLWGFAPLVGTAGLDPGSRGLLALNLIAGTATLNADAKGAGR